MIEVADALQLILERAQPRPAITKSLIDAQGFVLHGPITSDTDLPPFDKAMMDGYALRAADVTALSTSLPIAGTVMAGTSVPMALPAKAAALIMTGAPVPEGADAVVMRELATASNDDFVSIEQFPITPEQNLMRRGTICRRGDTVLPAAQKLGGAEIGVLAEVGLSKVAVTDRPSVAILPTGDELVSVGDPIKPGQIRNSNGAMLCSLVAELGSPLIDLGIGRDNRKQLEALVRRGLEADILVLSGGVSAGDLDLVPEVLAACGVQQVFHKVRLKPGKPLWFGTNNTGTLVFGLPGNPVSSLVCFQLFVAAAIRRMSGIFDEEARLGEANLTNAYSQRGDRPTYFPAIVRPNANGAKELAVLPWLGSSDLHTFTRANCLAVFPAGQSEFAVGTTVEYLSLPGHP